VSAGRTSALRRRRTPVFAAWMAIQSRGPVYERRLIWEFLCRCRQATVVAASVIRDDSPEVLRFTVGQGVRHDDGHNL
jgi:hypothetical protein